MHGRPLYICVRRYRLATLRRTTAHKRRDGEFAIYAYFDTTATSWKNVSRLYKDDLLRVTTREQFVGLLENVLDELYDPHSQLTTNTPNSFRLVPSGTDLWAEWRNGVATITEVRADSDAARASVKPRDTVVAFNNVAIAAAVESKVAVDVTRTNDDQDPFIAAALRLFEEVKK